MKVSLLKLVAKELKIIKRASDRYTYTGNDDKDSMMRNVDNKIKKL